MTGRALAVFGVVKKGVTKKVVFDQRSAGRGHAASGEPAPHAEGLGRGSVRGVLGGQQGHQYDYRRESGPERSRGEVRGLGRRRVGWGLPGLWKDFDFSSDSGRSEGQALSRGT